MRRSVPALCLACGLALLAIRTRTYAQSWQSDRTLWRVAVIQAPDKPRPWINEGEALAREGRWAEAQEAWQIAERAADLPEVPWWDRQAAHAIDQQNLATVARIVGHP